jgi:hypothetical protein
MIQTETYICLHSECESPRYVWQSGIGWLHNHAVELYLVSTIEEKFSELGL